MAGVYSDAANTKRRDPYKNFKFKVQWENAQGWETVAGVNQVSALSRSIEVITFRSGGAQTGTNPTPGQISWEPITLERGVTKNDQFQVWANKVWVAGTKDEEMSLTDFRRDLMIQLLDEAGKVQIKYKISNGWVSDYQALPELSAGDNSIAIQTITIQHEGWEIAA